MTPRLLIIFFTAFVIGGSIPLHGPVFAETIASRVAGRILLQVQEHGEGWYVDPVSLQRYYMGRPADAYALMRFKGLGIRHQELTTYLAGRFPARLSGRILLDVELHGEAYYVLPGKLTARYLGRADDAYAIMRSEGLGITNSNLAKISVAPDSAIPPGSMVTPGESTENALETFERRAFDLVNQHRVSLGQSALIWNDEIARIARGHSENIATRGVPFGHDGFEERVEEIKRTTDFVIHAVAENVALNNSRNPADSAVEQWLESVSHKKNIETADFRYAGMGAARDRDGSYIFTQLFME